MTDRIGEFLVKIGALTEAQVTEVLRVQGEGEEPRLFGEVAIELGYIDDAALKRYIDERAGA
ncbi:MAG: hypothetical protein WCL50_00345 [Spirochaetota bacterium]